MDFRQNEALLAGAISAWGARHFVSGLIVRGFRTRKGAELTTDLPASDGLAAVPRSNARLRRFFLAGGSVFLSGTLLSLSEGKMKL